MKYILPLIILVLLIPAAIFAENVGGVPAKNIPQVLQGQKMRLTFPKSGKFKILCLSDFHVYPKGPSVRTKQNIKKMIDRERPDLVLILGDNTWHIETAEKLKEVLTATMSYVEEKKIPWAHIYGNHDEDGSIKTAEQQKVYEAFKYCISQTGPAEVKGNGNYVLPIYSSKSDIPVFLLYGLDMGATPSSKHCGTISPAQWYKDISIEMEKYAGKKIPAMAFFHVALWEFRDIAEHPEKHHMEGDKRENVCTDSVTNGMMEAVQERRDVKIICVGNDHVNNYSGVFDGIKLCYCGTVSLEGYTQEATMGARVVIINEKDPENPTTTFRYLLKK